MALSGGCFRRAPKHCSKAAMRMLSISSNVKRPPPPRHSIENYWLGRVRRVVIDFDRDASNFEVYGRQYDPVLRRWIVNDAITKLNMLKLKPGSEQFMAFYLFDYHTYPIFDGKLVDAIRDAGFRGLQFSPLQPPIGKEKNRFG